MEFILEHSGTQEHTRMANNIKHLVERHLGHGIEHSIGANEDDLILYDQNLKQLIIFNTMPSLATLELVIELNS